MKDPRHSSSLAPVNLRFFPSPNSACCLTEARSTEIGQRSIGAGCTVEEVIEAPTSYDANESSGENASSGFDYFVRISDEGWVRLTRETYRGRIENGPLRGGNALR
ncbi:hypothetical protein NMY22_g2612 [Coprinellus aureogranulatus]|nr:hypothetical protein NMY22_g2612 [Coprinellus aureogranulatus]